VDELRGWTAIDTLYDLKGFQMAAALWGPLQPLIFAVFAGFGTLRALYKADEVHRYRKLVVYVMASIVLFWALEPVDVPVAVPAGYTYDASLQQMVESAATGRGPSVTVSNVPRLMALSHYAIGMVTRFMTSAVDASFEKGAFANDRAAVLLRMARITNDDRLRTDYQTFVVSCYLPLLADRERKNVPAPVPHYDPFKVASAEYQSWSLPSTANAQVSVSSSGPMATYNLTSVPGTPCPQAGTEIFPRLVTNVMTQQKPTLQVVNDVLVQAGGFGQKPGASNQPPTVDVVLRYVLHNETMGLLSTNEIALLQKALPDYDMFDGKTRTSGNSQTAAQYLRTAVSSLVKVKQSIDQWINHQAEGPATYYKATCYGPYAYGIAGMLVLAVFPLAASASLLPGHAKVLLAWGKMLLSIKLWIVFWAILSRFNEFRYKLEDVGSGPDNGIGDQSYIFPALAAMYLLTPGLSFAAVGLLSAAGGAAGNLLSSFLGQNGNSGIPGMLWGRGIQEVMSGEGGGAPGGGGGGSPIPQGSSAAASPEMAEPAYVSNSANPDPGATVSTPASAGGGGSEGAAGAAGAAAAGL
jgi:hypothetical protein